MRKEAKLEWFSETKIQNINFDHIIPDKNNSWINLTDNDWDELIPVADKNVKSGKHNKAIFQLYSTGESTNRDEWVIDFSKDNLSNKMKYFIEKYLNYFNRINKTFEDEIKWSRNLKRRFNQNIKEEFDIYKIKEYYYRPLIKAYIYESDLFIDEHGQTKTLFEFKNKAIAFSGIASTKPFQSLMINNYFSLDFVEKTQCLPLYRYNESGEKVANITDWGLEVFRERYGVETKPTSPPAPLLGGEGSKEGFSSSSHANDMNLIEGLSSSPLPPGEDLGEGGKGNSQILARALGEGGKGNSQILANYLGEGSSTTKYNYLHRTTPPILLQRARDMRKNPTDAEAFLWELVRGRRLDGLKFRRQVPYENFIMDFYCFEAKLCVELDGEIHNTKKQAEYDKMRTHLLGTSDIKVIRFKNDDVINNTEYVMQTILDAVSNDSAKEEPTEKVIEKEDIFHYVYAVLHNPAYRKKYEMNLKREFPRIPLYDDFWKWAAWGKELMDLHINFEEVEKADLQVVAINNLENPKTKLKADKDAGEIILDENTKLQGIPATAWEYKLGNRSALEWILDQYKEKKPKDPTIAEKFNTYRFADYKDKVIDLLMRVTTVSVETVKVVKEMEGEVEKN
jgi:predicted helicase